MVLDKEEHRVLLLEIIKTASFPGRVLELALELKVAIHEAKIEPQKEKKNAP